MNFSIEPFDKNAHCRDSFDCGVEELNIFLKLHANQNQSKNISKIYVAVSLVNIENPKTVYGYYTLSSGQIDCEQFPPNIKSKLPRYPVPIARIGRLAVNKNYERQGIGGFLLYDAFTRILDVSQKMGVFAIVVDAKYDATEFYKKYGFIPLQDSELTLFLPVKTLNQIY